jgi:carotenoid cleavage dioxygenase-like enzyme
MLPRRHFLHLAGLGAFGLVGCAERQPHLAEPALDPLPDDPSKPWWLRRNYAPVDESEAFDLPIVGALPPALTGLYLRNGPNPLGVDSAHWFLGDGMVHGVRLEAGKAPWYRARYVQTPVLGNPSMTDPLGLTDHQANTSVLAHRKRLFCLEEIGLPYEVSPSDLATIGAYDFNGALKTPMTAHPKLDPATGELLFFAYGVLQPSLTFHRVDPNGILVHSEKIPLPLAVMMHDFQITATHVVFMDLPIVFDLELAVAGEGFPYRWAPEKGARIGVMPRTGSAADVRWAAIDPCFVFHTFNAFHDPDDAGVIHLDAVRYETMWEKGANDFSASGQPHRFSFDLDKAAVTLQQLDDQPVEFPRINSQRQGLAYRYGYGVASSSGATAEAAPPMDPIVKYDRQTGARKVHALRAGQATDEAMFVPDPKASAEDDGWLLSYVFDHADNKSHLLVLDTSDWVEVARVTLPTRVPHGFHGDFLFEG